MKLNEIYGLSRSRDKKGNVVKRNINPFVNCLHTLTGHCRENMEIYVMEEYLEPKIAAMRGRTPQQKGRNNNYEQRLEINDTGTTNALTTVQKDNLVVAPKYRIRKLTPRECFRLQDVDDSDIDKIQATGLSNTQQYKLAGNSICISPLYHILRKMFVDTGTEESQGTLF